jgi:hypothetical protein
MNLTYQFKGTYSVDYRGRGEAESHLVCNERAKGSSPFDSTILKEPIFW